MNGESGVVEPTFVKSPLYASEGVEYFASNVELGPEGVKKIHPIGSLSSEEEQLIKGCLAECVMRPNSTMQEKCEADEITGYRRTSERERSSPWRDNHFVLRSINLDTNVTSLGSQAHSLQA